MVRIGIIGMGGYAGNHWDGLAEVERAGACRVVAAAVIDPQNHPGRIEAARARGVEVFGTAGEMFDAMRGRMDAVTIPTGIYSHAELMIAAVQSGYHVYLEKPPAATIQEVDEMLAAGRRTGKLCAVGFQALWSQSMAFLKLRLNEGTLGEVRTVACAAGSPRRREYYERNEWAGRVRVGQGWVLDGPMNNALSHQIANMLCLATPRWHRMANPAAVRAELYRANDIESEDTSAVEIITQEGPRCYFLATHCSDETFGPDLTLIAERATAYRSYEGRVSIRYADGRVEEPVLDDTRQEVEKFENFVAAVSANDADLLQVSLEMCRPFTLAVNGAFESARRVRAIGEQHVRTVGSGWGSRRVIEGIDAAILQAASGGKLFSDLGLEWGHRTATFDLSGYESFPVQFEVDETAEQARTEELPFG